MSLTGMAWTAVGVIAVLLVIVELLARAAKASFFTSVILGQDGRTSTSKTFIFMWTLLVGWALITLLIAGEFVSAHACVSAHNALQACKKDDVGLLQLGWHHFVNSGLAGSYLVLLGVPAAAGVAAKGITQQQVNSAAGFKTAKPRKLDPFARIAEVFSADDGTTDIGDFQYLIFNLITAVYFVVQFVNPDGSGLPTIPDTLLGLTGVSASLYVGKKAVSRTQPTITGVFPQPIHDGSEFTIIGTGLGQDPAAQVETQPQITIDALPATLMRVTETGNVIAKAPADLSLSGTPAVRQLQVLNPYGGLSPKFDVQCL